MQAFGFGLIRRMIEKYKHVGLSSIRRMWIANLKSIKK
jgi:hypothetical protein